MTDRIKISQVVGQVEGDLTPQVKVTQALGQVEGGLPPQVKVTQLLAQVEYEASTALQGSVGVVVSGNGVVGFVTPLVLAVVGSVGVSVGGAGVVTGGPTADAHIGSVGVVVGGAGVVVGAGVSAPILPLVTAVVGSVGVELAGDGVVDFVTPSLLAVVGSVGVLVDGKGIISAPAIDAHVGSVGLRVGGDGVVASVQPTAPPVMAVVGSVGILVGATGVLDTGVPSVLAVIGSVGIQIGEFRVPELTVVQFISPAELILEAITGSVGIEIGGAGVVTQTSPSVFAVTVPQSSEGDTIKIGVVGIIAFIHPQILAVIGEGEVLIGGAPVSGDIFSTFVLTGARSEPSIYSGFNFNSYARYRNQYYGAGEDGIYLMEGEDDAGVEIHSGIKIGPVNLGTDREKRLRLLRCGGSTTGAQVKVSDDQGGAGYFDVEKGRAGVSREVQGRELTIEIADFETLDHLEIVPLVLAKR